jgi:hypothetical protein
MHTTHTLSSSATHASANASAAHPMAASAWAEAPSSPGFVALLAAYRSTGGIARAKDLSNVLQDHSRGGYTSLARLMTTGKVFSFKWRNTHWVPMFQFNLMDLSIKPGPQQVVAELRDVLDDWLLACWFAESHAALQGGRPVDLIDTRLADVLDAAREDRWVVAG